MNKEVSILLPGAFFENDYHRKLNYLSSKNINCIYIYDHSVNPAETDQEMYEIKKSISLLQDSAEFNFHLGICVLNINKRKMNLLFSDYINPLLEIQNFRLGLGTGDNKYEIMEENFNNNLDTIINELISSYIFSVQGKNLFVGGTSDKKIDLVKKYSIGINQWLGNVEKLKLLANNIGNIKNPLGRFSHCQKIHKINSSLPSNLEQIFVLKDSNLEDFYSQADKISL